MIRYLQNSSYVARLVLVEKQVALGRVAIDSVFLLRDTKTDMGT